MTEGARYTTDTRGIVGGTNRPREATYDRHPRLRPRLDALPHRPRARGSHRPLVGLLTPLAHASSTALTVVAAVLAAALVGAYVALALLLIAAVLRVVRPRLDDHR